MLTAADDLNNLLAFSIWDPVQLFQMPVEASWIAIRKEQQLLKYYRRHAVKNSKHAIIKVARRLALIARTVVQKS
jgi:hypothetical protein